MGLGVLMRGGGECGVGGLRDPQIWGGDGGLGSGCPYEEGSVGWGSQRPPNLGWGWGSWGWVSLCGEECGVGVSGTSRYGVGMGVLGLGVLMRRGVWGGGLRDPQIWGAGLGVLGLDVPTVVGSAGWGSEGPPDMGGWVGGLGAGCLPWGGGLRDPQIWGGDGGAWGWVSLLRWGVWVGGLRDPQIWERVGGLGAGRPHCGGECGVGV